MRLVCYCRDCQAFARFLERPDILDSAGGSDIVQMPIGGLALTAGSDAIRCLRLSPTVYRWYAGCCRTPIGNTAGPRFPVVGLIHPFIDGLRLDETLGAPRCRIFDGSALGPLAADAPAPASPGLRVLRMGKLLGWWATGRGRPNPFFDARTREPLCTPRIFTPRERAALQRSVTPDG